MDSTSLGVPGVSVGKDTVDCRLLINYGRHFRTSKVVFNCVTATRFDRDLKEHPIDSDSNPDVLKT